MNAIDITQRPAPAAVATLVDRLAGDYGDRVVLNASVR